MLRIHSFGLFMEDEKGPLWRGFFDNLTRAKKAARELAEREGLEFFVFSFQDYTEVTRAFPPATNAALGVPCHALTRRHHRGLPEAKVVKEAKQRDAETPRRH